jgi:hypothetical protein
MYVCKVSRCFIIEKTNCDSFPTLDMNKESTTCSELIERTADAIDDDALKLLFVTVQMNNLDACIRKCAKL